MLYNLHSQKNIKNFHIKKLKLWNQIYQTWKNLTS